jgi:hypothetical protein
MRGAIPSLPHYVFMAWCLVKHKDFTFTFIDVFSPIYKVKGKDKVVPDNHHAMKAYWGVEV